nr:MAG TPA_asm: hypothetical protein [Caudoviricetes sp.]
MKLFDFRAIIDVLPFLTAARLDFISDCVWLVKARSV